MSKRKQESGKARKRKSGQARKRKRKRKRKRERKRKRKESIGFLMILFGMMSTQKQKNRKVRQLDREKSIS